MKDIEILFLGPQTCLPGHRIPMSSKCSKFCEIIWNLKVKDVHRKCACVCVWERWRKKRVGRTIFQIVPYRAWRSDAGRMLGDLGDRTRLPRPWARQAIWMTGSKTLGGSVLQISLFRTYGFYSFLPVLMRLCACAMCVAVWEPYLVFNWRWPTCSWTQPPPDMQGIDEKRQCTKRILGSGLFGALGVWIAGTLT